ncbi:MAG TPA: phosphorylase [Methylocella sp.]|nr:phosphorylase [Methylocella sp.]
MRRPKIIAATGLKTEARIIAGPHVHAIACGGDTRRLEDALERLAGNRAAAIISFGVAGGLMPGLAPGVKLIARSVISEDGASFACDPVWSERLMSVSSGALRADIAGVSAPLATYGEKHALYLRTGAQAADMESHVAARVAATHNLPFAAFRVVADPAERRLPHAALVALNPDGSIAFWAIARSLLGSPAQIPQLLRIGKDAQVAFFALFRSRKLLAGTLGIGDFSELALDVPAEDILSGTLEA